MRQQWPSCLTSQKWWLQYSKYRHKAEERPERVACDCHTQPECPLRGWLIRRIERQRCGHDKQLARVKLCNAIWKLSNCQHSWSKKSTLVIQPFNPIYYVWRNTVRILRNRIKYVASTACLKSISNMNTKFVHLTGVSKFLGLWPVGIKHYISSFRGNSHVALP